jgi:hypothetical protein
VLDRAWLSGIGDDRWDHSLGLLEDLGGPDPRYVEVGDAIARDRRGKTAYTVHYNESSSADERHAEHLRGAPGLELVAHPAGGRAVVQWLRVSERLMPIFRSAVEA